MPPRKSLPRSAASRSDTAGSASLSGPSGSQKASGQTTGNRTTKSLPAISMPESVTPAFKRQKIESRVLDDDERGILIHELVGFYPRKLCDLVQEVARQNVYDTVGSIEAWAQNKTASMGDEYRMEVDIGLHSLETLLESQVDKAFDKFTAWALRNPFDAPSDLELVLPWHKDLDFERGQHIASLPEGETSILSDLDNLRRKVEQSRYLSQQLERAEKLLDQRLEIANQRQSEIGFISETIASSNLHPLGPKSSSLKTSLLSLQSLLATMEDPHPSLQPTSTTGANPGNLKAWEMGRQAYLSWAVGRAVGQYQAGDTGTGVGGGASGVGATDEMGDVGREIENVGGVEGVEGIMKAIGR